MRSVFQRRLQTSFGQVCVKKDGRLFVCAKGIISVFSSSAGFCCNALTPQVNYGLNALKKLLRHNQKCEKKCLTSGERGSSPPGQVDEIIRPKQNRSDNLIVKRMCVRVETKTLC